MPKMYVASLLTPPHRLGFLSLPFFLKPARSLPHRQSISSSKMLARENTPSRQEIFVLQRRRNVHMPTTIISIKIHQSRMVSNRKLLTKRPRAGVALSKR